MATETYQRCHYVKHRQANVKHRQTTLLFSWIKERLWVKPLALCVLSVGDIFVARLADDAGLSRMLPDVTLKSVESLLSIMASSMRVIATFAVGSMVAAYAFADRVANWHIRKPP